MSTAQKQAICSNISRGLDSNQESSSSSHEHDLRFTTDPSSSFILPGVEISREELSHRLHDCFSAHGANLPLKNLVNLLNAQESYGPIPEGRVPLEQILEVGNLKPAA